MKSPGKKIPGLDFFLFLINHFFYFFQFFADIDFPGCSFVVTFYTFKNHFFSFQLIPWYMKIKTGIRIISKVSISSFFKAFITVKKSKVIKSRFRRKFYIKPIKVFRDFLSPIRLSTEMSNTVN